MVTTEAHKVNSTQFESATTESSAGGALSPRDIFGDLAIRGCGVCRRLHNSLFGMLVSWQKLLAVDELSQSTFATELGFCPLHTWQLASISSPQDLCVGFSFLTDRLKTELDRAALTVEDIDGIKRLCTTNVGCRLCSVLREMHGNYILGLVNVLRDASGREAYAESRGVCLRHLVALVSALDDSEVRQFVVGIAEKDFASLSAGMRSFAQKHGALSRHLITITEQRSLLNALAKVASAKSLCVPWEFGEIQY